MVIFNSYVSLPEGMSNINRGKSLRSCLWPALSPLPTSQALHQTWIRQGKADSPAKQGWNQTDFHEFSWEDRNIHDQRRFIAGKIHVSDLLESMIFLSIIPMGHPLEIRGICREYCCFFLGGLGCLCKSKWVWFGEIAMFGSFIAYSGEHHTLCCNFNVVLVLGWKRGAIQGYPIRTYLKKEDHEPSKK